MPQVPKPGVSIHKKAKTFKGFTLFAPLRSDRAHLIDMAGEVVHSWKLHGGDGINHAMMLPGGRMFIGERGTGQPPPVPARGGRLREYDWEGKVLWEHLDPDHHHDARRLPKGGAAYLAWEKIPKKFHRRIKGGMPGTEAHGTIYGDVIREVNEAGKIVWEWRCWEHMALEEHPIIPLYSREEFGHANTLVPLDDGNYLIGFRILNTMLVVDRKTKKVKWQHRDDTWGGQHDGHFLANGNILVFANGNFVAEPYMQWPYSRVIELNLRTRKEVWSWKAPYVLEFYSPHISGAQRLPNGNTLVCEGGYGRLFELTPAGEIVWEYVSPFYVPGRLGHSNSIFRAKRYAANSPEIGRRLK
jgi:hypothetical protein